MQSGPVAAVAAAPQPAPAPQNKDFNTASLCKYV